MRTIQNKKRVYKSKKRTMLKKRFLLTICTIAFAVFGTAGFGGMMSSAQGNSKEDPVSFKYYKSIEIKEGDTLWGIAEEYMADEYESVQEYVEELKEINRLVTDDIQSSKYLTIAYYDSEFK